MFPFHKRLCLVIINGCRLLFLLFLLRRLEPLERSDCKGVKQELGKCRVAPLSDAFRRMIFEPGATVSSPLVSQQFHLLRFSSFSFSHKRRLRGTLNWRNDARDLRGRLRPKTNRLHMCTYALMLLAQCHKVNCHQQHPQQLLKTFELLILKKIRKFLITHN